MNASDFREPDTQENHRCNNDGDYAGDDNSDTSPYHSRHSSVTSSSSELNPKIAPALVINPQISSRWSVSINSSPASRFRAFSWVTVVLTNSIAAARFFVCSKVLT